MIIKVKDIIDTAFSLDDAEKLSAIIKDSLGKLKSDEETIDIDFNEVRYFTTLFFNNAIVKYVGEIGVGEFVKRFNCVNLSNVGKTTYLHSLENGKEYYSLSEDERNLFDEVLRQNELDD